MTVFHLLKKWALIVSITLFIFIFFYFRLYNYLTLSTFKHYQHVVQDWSQQHYILSVITFISLFTILIACTIPCATVFSIIGGFLFGFVAVFYSVLAETLGGVILFYAVRFVIGPKIYDYPFAWMKVIEQGYKENAFNYILFLRFIPVMPCWVSNVSAGALGVPLRPFLLATIIGVTPATLIYVLAGRGLDQLVSLNEDYTTLLLRPGIFIPLMCLAFLSLFPVFYKYFFKKRRLP